MSKILHEFQLGTVSDELQGLSDIRLVQYDSNIPGRIGAKHYWATDELGKSVHLSADKVADSILASHHSGYDGDLITDANPATTGNSVIDELARRYPSNTNHENSGSSDTSDTTESNPYGYHEGPGSLEGTWLDEATNGSEKTKKSRRQIGQVAGVAVAGFLLNKQQAAAEMSPRKKKVIKAIGAVAGLAALGAGAYLLTKGIMNHSSGNNTANEATNAPKPFPTKYSGVESNPYVSAPKNPSAAVDTITTNTPTPPSTSLETTISLPNPSNPTVENAVVIPTSKVAEFSDLNPTAIKTSPDVMPWTNVVNAGSHNPNSSIQSGLEQYNDAYGRNFNLGQGGMFWEGNHVISPSELEQYNTLMQKLAAAASNLEEISDTLPSTL